MAVAVASLGFKVVHLLAPGNTGQDLGLFVLAVVWNDGLHGFAKHVVGRVAEYLFGPMVPARNDALHRFADDGVVGRVNDGFDVHQIQLCQLALCLCNPAQHAVGTPLVHLDRGYKISTAQVGNGFL